MAKLFVVGTPIGNMQDITLRAIETLKSVDVIACEDTRHSLPLLNKYEIRAQLLSYHKFNEAERSAQIISLIAQGKNVAVISDAGMPCISDPGAEVVRACRDAGVDIEVVPGPSALTSAIAISGTRSNGFVFLGFLPEKSTDREKVVKRADSSGLPIVLYVAPHDLKKTADFLLGVLGDRTVRVARELTKIHESLTITTLANFNCEERGEIVMIIDPQTAANPLNQLTIAQHIQHYLALGADKKEAIKLVAQDRGLPKNEVYRQALDL